MPMSHFKTTSIFPVAARFRKLSLLLLLLIGCSMLAVLLRWSYFAGYWRFNYPDPHKYPVAGIDVSHHQGDIEWTEVSKHKFAFVFVKATEGGDFKDPRFHDNWRGAAKAGLARGAYHFFTYRKTGAEQAMNFIASVPVEKDALPPVVDFEFGGDPDDWPAKEPVLTELFDFLKRVEKVYGKRPIIYATYEAYERYLVGAVGAYPLWIRDIVRKPRVPDRNKWTFWQYANNGRVRGILHRTDLNVFAGSAEEFERFAQRMQWTKEPEQFE